MSASSLNIPVPQTRTEFVNVPWHCNEPSCVATFLTEVDSVRHYEKIHSKAVRVMVRGHKLKIKRSKPGQGSKFVCLFEQCDYHTIDSRAMSIHLQRAHDAKELRLETQGSVSAKLGRFWKGLTTSTPAPATPPSNQASSQTTEWYLPLPTRPIDTLPHPDPSRRNVSPNSSGQGIPPTPTNPQFAASQLVPAAPPYEICPASTTGVLYPPYNQPACSTISQALFAKPPPPPHYPPSAYGASVPYLLPASTAVPTHVATTPQTFTTANRLHPETYSVPNPSLSFAAFRTDGFFSGPSAALPPPPQQGSGSDVGVLGFQVVGYDGYPAAGGLGGF